MIIILLLAFALPSAYLAIHGLNLYWLTAIFLRRSRLPMPASPPPEPSSPPLVVTQLPVYNEYNVVEQVMRAAVLMRYAGRHIVQVLDDSTDGTRAVVDRITVELRLQGHDIRVVRRKGRDGYKAGALKHGMQEQPADFYAIFDADFIPPPDFLERCMPAFARDPGIGFVQCRWGHVNEQSSWLTKVISIGMDGHFAVEQSARCRGGMYLNFNGTAGIWRTRAIVDAGGWSADTLTEDMDLSYRVQLAGWKAWYDGSICVPAEVPEDMNAFKQQQFRWAKGSIQTARKLLPRIWKASLPWRVKIEATLHMTHYSIHPVMLWMALAAFPGMIWFPRGVLPLGLFYLTMMVVASAAPSLLYTTALRTIHGNAGRRLWLLPVLSAVGAGLALNNTRAVVEALLGRDSAFVRTPKRGVVRQKRYPAACHPATMLEVGLSVLSAVNLGIALWRGYYWIAPFMLIYAVGFFAVGFGSIRDLLEHLRMNRQVLATENIAECET